MVLGEGPSKGSGVDSESEIQCEKKYKWRYFGSMVELALQSQLFFFANSKQSVK